MVDLSIWRRINQRSGARAASKSSTKTGRSAGELEQGPFTGEIARPTKMRARTTMGGGYKYDGKSYSRKAELPKEVQKTVRAHPSRSPSGSHLKRASATAALAGAGSVAKQNSSGDSIDQSRVARAKAASTPKTPRPGSIDAVARSIVQRAKTSPKAKAAKVNSSEEVSTPRSNPKRKAVGTTTHKPIPKSSPKPKPQANLDSKTFGSAFSSARGKGLKEFTWKGKRYTTKVA